MDLFEAIRNRRCVRSLESVSLPQDHLEKILDAGRRAPSGRNAQPLQYIVVRDKATIEKFGKVQGFIPQASALIFIVASPEQSQYWLEDASAAAENMFLAITALGYASCWVEGTLVRQEDWAKQELGVPAERRLIIVLPIGKAAAPGAQADKKLLSELVSYERYGSRSSGG